MEYNKIMKITQKEKEVLEIIRNLTHENTKRINNFFLGLMTYALLNYTDNEPITVPYFGTFMIKYKGDKITEEGKEAILEGYFVPSEYMKENIGAYEDYKRSSSKNISSIPIMKFFESMNERALHLALNDSIERDEDE